MSSPNDLRPEPNTLPDLDDTVMQQDANTVAADEIFFDAVFDVWAFGTPIVPHFSAEGTSPQPYGGAYFHAYLGYWRDCNGDGFIGDAVLGGDHYPVTGANDLGICSEATPYSDGTYFTEFLAIGDEANKDFEGTPYGEVCDNVGLCVGGASYFVRDDAAKVWHDWGLPTDQPASTRLLLPFPQGTFSDTNGHFQYVDSLTFGRLSGTGSGGECLLSDGTNTYCWLWPSGQGKTDQYGDARVEADSNQCTGDDDGDGLTDDPVANAAMALSNMDCSPIPNVPNPVTSTTRDRYNDSHTNEKGTTVIEPWDWGSEADPQCELRGDAGASTVNPDGAVVPTFQHVYVSAVEECRRTNVGGGWPTYNNLEAPAAPSDVGTLKVSADTGLGFTLDSWFNPADVGGPDQEVCIPDVSTINHANPATCRGYWLSGSQWILTMGTTGLNPQPFSGLVSTFYADVNFAPLFGPDRYSAPEGLNDSPSALPAGSNDAHVYGEEQCSLGDASAWNCDPQAWIDAAEISGANEDELIHLLPKVLDPYDLRDVECFDNDLGGQDTVDDSGVAPGLILFTPARDCQGLDI